jgi:predicted nuclease of predicted toxin-antitoxin system
MPLSVYMDVHIPLAITDGLRRRNIDVVTSQEDATTERDDELLLARASELGRLLFTQDEDFLRIAAEWSRASRPFIGVLYAHQQGASLGRIIEDIELIATCAEPGELANRTTYLPLRASP